jgi:hypothetical protein
MKRTPLPTRTVALARRPMPPRVAGLRNRRRRHVATNTPARREDLTNAQRFVLWSRPGGHCEGALVDECWGYVPLDQFEACHRQGRGQGGNNKALWNRWCGCPPCHRTAGRSQHNRPLAAEQRGLWVRSGRNPADVPMTLPDGRSVLLGASGAYLEVAA